MRNGRKKMICLVVLLCIIALSFLIVRRFAYIENNETLTPTGNMDIFEIGCMCCRGTGGEEDESDDIDIPKTGRKETSGREEKKEEEKDEEDTKPDERTPDLGDVIVYDDYKIWDNKDLRIFSNPAYEYKNIIAPGSSNSYAFIIRNNNDYDVSADIVFNETNYNNINMKFKLRNDGDYLLGSASDYDFIKGKKIENVELPAKGYKSYILDWKWVDNANDAEVGFDINSFYKLSITVAAR